MTKDQKDKFELMNSCWTLLKPYVGKQEKAYKDVMTEYFNILSKDRGQVGIDKWRDSLVKDLIAYPEKLKSNQELCGFAAELSLAIGDYLTAQDYSNYAFYKCVGKAFVNTWERFNEEKNEKKTTG